MTASVTAQMNQITGPHEAIIHRPAAANGKKTASMTAASCQCGGIRSSRHSGASIVADQSHPVEQAEQHAVDGDDALEPAEQDLDRRRLQQMALGRDVAHSLEVPAGKRGEVGVDRSFRQLAEAGRHLGAPALVDNGGLMPSGKS